MAYFAPDRLIRKLAPAVVVLAFLTFSLLLFSSSAHADCTGNEIQSPEINQISMGGPNQIILHWIYIPGSVCVYPPNFWQVRWTQGPGPATQHQSPQISVQDAASRSYAIKLDTAKEWSFVVQACVSRFAQSSLCTHWSAMAHYIPK